MKRFYALTLALAFSLGLFSTKSEAAFDPNIVETKATIALLRLNVAPYPAINILGYYGNNTPGGGTFYLNSSDTTSVDNGGTIIVDAAGHRYYRQGTNGYYSVYDFGAKCDDSTDDLLAIDAAYSAANGTTYQGVVTFPPASCVVSATITVNPNTQDGDAPSTLGAQAATSIVKMKAGFATGTPIFRVRGASPSKPGTKFQNLHLVGLSNTDGNNYIGIEHINGCFYIYDTIIYDTLNIGQKWIVAGAGFAEGNRIVGNSYAVDTKYGAVYEMASGASGTSFNETGFGQTFFMNLDDVSGSSVVLVSSANGDPLVYDVPFNVRVWASGSSTFFQQNSGSANPARLYGNIETELTGSATLGSGTSKVFFVGTESDHVNVPAFGTFWGSTSRSAAGVNNFILGQSLINSGSGDPNGSVTGFPGDLYMNTAGGANTSLYVKESGSGTNTGWSAK